MHYRDTTGTKFLYLHSISNETSQCEENATANKIPYSCDICETTFEAASDLNSHIYAKHGNSESNRNSRKGRVDQLLNCDQCSFVSDNNNDLLLHQDSNHDSAALMSTTIYTCDICDVSYNCNCELSDHTDMHRIYSCEQCEFMSFGQYLMQDHMSSSHLHLACNECEFIAKSKGGLTRHRNAKHENHTEPKDQNQVDLTTETEEREEPSFLTFNLPVKFS